MDSRFEALFDLSWAYSYVNADPGCQENWVLFQRTKEVYTISLDHYRKIRQSLLIESNALKMRDYEQDNELSPTEDVQVKETLYRAAPRYQPGGYLWAPQNTAEFDSSYYK